MLEGQISSHDSTCAIGSINSHYFHVIGDKLINPIVGVYIPIIRIPVIKGWMTIPQYRELIDPGSHDHCRLLDGYLSNFDVVGYTPGAPNIAGWKMDPD